MKAVFYSHRGNERKGNEDALLARGCLVSGASMEHPATADFEGSNGLFAVVDGMGGYEGSALAAKMTVLSLLEGLSGDDSPDEESLRTLLRETAERMRTEAEYSPSLSSMGATLAGLVLREGVATAFNCGDCRVYRFRSGYLDRLSRDHSVVQELVDRGEIEEDDMRTHPRKNVVTSAVQASAAGQGTSVFLREFTYVEGDAFFLCSDGVWEALPVEALEECLRMEDMTEGCNELRKRLLETDCKDNITFVFLRV